MEHPEHLHDIGFVGVPLAVKRPPDDWLIVVLNSCSVPGAP